MTTTTVWGRASAFNVQKVLWALDELGVAFEHVELGGRFGGLDTEAFRAMNPHGRVPVLADDAGTVWESHTILRYVASVHAGPPFWPDSPIARSRVERWMDWAQTSLQPDFMRLFWGYYRTPEAERNERVIAAARDACARHYDRLDAELSTRPYLAGDDFTLADIPAGTSLHRYFGMGLPVPDPPNVAAWHARLRERAPYRQRIAIPFEELFARTDF